MLEPTRKPSTGWKWLIAFVILVVFVGVNGAERTANSLNALSNALTRIGDGKPTPSDVAWILFVGAIAGGVWLAVTVANRRQCPFCKSGVPVKATKCKHCGSDLS